VRRLGLDDLDRDAERFDRAAAASVDIDGFCSSTAWVLPAAEALMAPGRPVVLEEGGAFAAFMVRRHENATMLEPLELSWALACPLVGPDPAILVELAAAATAEARVDLTVIAGVVEGSSLFTGLVGRLARHRLGRGPTTERHLASLDGGVDGFLARRSRDLRKALRRAAGRAVAAGVGFEHHVPTSALEAAEIYRRIHAVEARSWKGINGTGLLEAGMARFYQRMLERLAARRAARVTFARRADRDVGFVFGARFGTRYRGLQFSFDDAERDLGLGNLAQLEVVTGLSAEGVTTYDLGTGGDYKRRWCESVLETVALIVAPR